MSSPFLSICTSLLSLLLLLCCSLPVCAVAVDGYLVAAYGTNTGSPITYFSVSWVVPPIPLFTPAQSTLYAYPYLQSINQSYVQAALQFQSGQGWSVACFIEPHNAATISSPYISVQPGQLLTAEIRAVSGNATTGYFHSCQFIGIGNTYVTQTATPFLLISYVVFLYAVEPSSMTPSYYPACGVAFTNISFQLSTGVPSAIGWIIQLYVTSDTGEYGRVVSSANPNGEVDLFWTSSQQVCGPAVVVRPVSSSSSTGGVRSISSSSSSTRASSSSPALSSSSSSPAALPSTQSASLCILLYSLPGDVSYPFSVAYSLRFVYNTSALTTIAGTAVALVTGGGTRVFTNRFGSSFSTNLTLEPSAQSSNASLLYFNSSLPFDSIGLTFALFSPVQLPGASPTQLLSQVRLSSSGAGVSDGSAILDGLSQAYLSSLPGFSNTSIGASSINSLAPNYQLCSAPIGFTNGLRSPTQPSVANGGLHVYYSYSISDGVTYSVQTNLSITTNSPFATTQDMLGNPYQTVVSITGSRTYTLLPYGITLMSAIVGIANSSASATPHADQRFSPYAFLASAPGVYQINNAPFLDSAGLSFLVSPAVPPNGQLGGAMSGVVSVFLSLNSSSSTATLTESPTSTNPPLMSLQRQAYSFSQ